MGDYEREFRPERFPGRYFSRVGRFLEKPRDFRVLNGIEFVTV
jgi:hypothetical protein